AELPAHHARHRGDPRDGPPGAGDEGRPGGGAGHGGAGARGARPALHPATDRGRDGRNAATRLSMSSIGRDSRGAWRAALACMVTLAVAMGLGRFAFTPMLPVMLHEGHIDLQGGGLLA